MAVDQGYIPATYGADGTQVLMGYFRRPVISGLGATRTLTASEAGAIILFDKADGIIVTLPAPIIGMEFLFKVKTSITSNAAKIITSGASIFLVGGIVNLKTDLTTLFSIGNGSSHIAVSMNGSTTGALIGTALKFTCISSTLWLVEGINLASGAIATPFSAS